MNESHHLFVPYLGVEHDAHSHEAEWYKCLRFRRLSFSEKIMSSQQDPINLPTAFGSEPTNTASTFFKDIHQVCVCIAPRRFDDWLLISKAGLMQSTEMCQQRNEP